MSVTAPRGLSRVRTELECGAVVLAQQTRLTPAVTIHAAFTAGALYEPDGLTGLAHLTGRLLDRGTERRTGAMIADELDDRGVALKVSTNRHVLTLTCTCLSEDFDAVLSILVDVARRPVFPESELALRRAELVTAYLQDQDNPATRATEALFHLLYGEGHPYSGRIKGTADSLQRIGRGDLVQFHAARFRPASLSLAVVGDVEPARVVHRSAMELEGWDGGPPELRGVPPPVEPGTRRARMVSVPGKSQTDVAYGFVAIRRLDPRYYAYWLMNNVLGQFGLGGRLADNIRERQGMAYYAYSVLDPSVGEGPLVIRAGVDPRNVERAIEAIDHEVDRLGREGPTPGEVEESRQYLIGSIPRMLETNQGIAAFLQNAEHFGLGLDYDRRLAQHLREVTADEVAAAASELLVPTRAALAVAGPTPADGGA
ncbi:MAG TPA: pitrilysin family protein [Vicinamibacterales bacterium]|nr:pitrilysin family protein [Vicinamibacterales bacterium]